MEAPFKTYVCRYYYEGSWWGLNIMARDHEDAERRVAKLGNLQLQGELKMTIPAIAPHWFIETLCRVRNFLGGTR